VSRRVSEDCLSDLKLDRWLSGDLPPEEIARASSHVEQCPPCRARREVLVKDREAFALAPPALTLPTELSSARRRGWLLAAVAGVAAAAALGLIWLGRGSAPEPVVVNDVVRSKGSPFELAAVVERAGHQVRARSGDFVGPGDRVQLAYSTSTPVYLYVVGVDGTKRATVYYPEGADPSRVEPGSEVELPFSLVIDATPGVEQFYGVACDQARAPLEGSRAVEAGGSAPTLSGCEVSGLRLEKRL
jgi:hypothetical protein